MNSVFFVLFLLYLHDNFINNLCFYFFFIKHPATPEIYTLSLHDALPILASTAMRVADGTASRNSSTYLPATPSALKDRKSTRLNSSHVAISYAVFCLKKKNRLFYS